MRCDLKIQIPSKFAKRAARYNEFYCKQRNSRTFVPRQETCHIFPAEPPVFEGHLGNLCTHDHFSPRTCANPSLHILPFLRKVGGVVGGLKYLRGCLQALPFSLLAVFARSLMRCLRAFFASRSLFSLIYSDREPGTGYLI